jgi:hypothetical protein
MQSIHQSSRANFHSLCNSRRGKGAPAHPSRRTFALLGQGKSGVCGGAV